MKLYPLCIITFATLLAPTLANATSKADSIEYNNLRSFLQETINSSTSFDDKFSAEVWLISQSGKLKRYIKDEKSRIQLLKAVHHEATALELNPDLVLALIQIESAFNRYAVSRVGAQGLMQVMPFWKKEIGRPEDNLTDMMTNLKYGCRILKYYIKMEDRKGGGLAMALARYNGSYPRTVYTEKVMDAFQYRWNSGL